jgi:dolichol-phosphate mannosyltransferase
MASTPRLIREASISVVVPVFNEKPVLPELRRRLTGILEEVTPRFEVLLIDDGSTDGTAELADRIHDEDARFKCVHFSRNFGHQAAVTAGLRYATGDVTCVMDADLQDPPEVLLSLFAEWEKGGDAVYAVRRNRKEHGIKVGLYKLFYRLLSRLASIRIPLDAGDFCLLSREVREEINRLPEKERFVRGLRAWVGYSQVGVEYDRQARRGGESKYTFVGLLRLAINGIVSFSDKPLIYLTVFGLGISLVAFLSGGYLIAVRMFYGNVITGYASLMSGLLFLSGLQLMAMGVLGIYVSKIFQEVKARPTYVVRSLRGIPEAPASSTGLELERAR